MGIRVVEESVPRTVARHLRPEEQQVITVRRHYLKPALGVVPLALAGADYLLRAAGAVHGTAQARFILAVLLAPCGILAVYSIAAWLLRYFVVTPQRMLVLGWWRISRTKEIPLSEAAELSFIRTFPGRLFGYGTFRLKLPGSRWRMVRIRFVPYPEQLYLEVCGLIFRAPGGEPSDD